MTRMCLRRAVVIALIVLAIAIGTAKPASAETEVLIGAWKFIPERSTFTQGSVPYQNMTLNFSVAQRGLRNLAKGIDADGTPIEATYMIVEDGKYYPVRGVAAFDSSSYTRVGDRNTVYVRRKRGTTVIVGSRIVSRDGKTLTFREKTVDNQGKQLSTAVLFFIREGVDLASLAPPPGSAPPPPPPVAAVPPPPPNSSPDEDAGDAALASGNDDEAIRLYTKAIEATEKTPRLYYDYVSRGVAYLRKDQTAEAMKDFDEALKLKPDDLDARFRRGGLLVQRKQYEAAIEDLSKFLEADEDATDPNRAMALRLRGFSYNTLQQDVKAGADYKAACMINEQLDVCN
jgi:tetratricopeptide (TPR) repeat protein